MDEEELAISQSTPGCRFDVAPVAEPAPLPQPQPTAALDEEAEAFVSEVVNDFPVVMFALEWCEFSWSVRKLFARLGIDYKSVDLDSVPFQKNDIGGKIRAVLKARIGSPTIPQVFVGGAHIGGCTELFEAMREGSMQRRLEAAGVDYDASADVDPYSLLPKWMHPRKSA